jgi:hypothetical protein
MAGSPASSPDSQSGRRIPQPIRTSAFQTRLDGPCNLPFAPTIPVKKSPRRHDLNHRQCSPRWEKSRKGRSPGPMPNRAAWQDTRRPAVRRRAGSGDPRPALVELTIPDLPRHPAPRRCSPHWFLDPAQDETAGRPFHARKWELGSETQSRSPLQGSPVRRFAMRKPHLHPTLGIRSGSFR